MRYFRENPELTEIAPADLEHIEHMIAFAKAKDDKAKGDFANLLSDPEMERRAERSAKMQPHPTKIDPN